MPMLSVPARLPAPASLSGRARLSEPGRLSARVRLSVPALAAVALLAGCGNRDTSPQAVPLGNFVLGYNIVVADKMQQVGPSREATQEEWIAAMKSEIDRVFKPYDGDKLYHVAVSVDAYALALPGIPVVLNPKSVLVVSANVWDDAAGKKLNAEPKQITVFESASGKGLVGSGLTQTKEEQMANLAKNATIEIQEWMAENPEWFGIAPGAAPVVAPLVAPVPAPLPGAPAPATSPAAGGVITQPLPVAP